MKLKKHITLLLAALIVMGVFFLLPRNKVWVRDAVLTYWHDFLAQKDNLDTAYRKKQRYGLPYTISKRIADFFSARQNKPVLVLIPPTAYFKKNNIPYHVPEPAVFYYFTGLKTVWVNSDEAVKANWYVHAKNGQLVIDSVTDIRAFTDTIKAFKTYPVTL